MIILGTIARGSADPATEEFDQISAEGADYAAARAELDARVPDGWKLASVSVEG